MSPIRIAFVIPDPRRFLLGDSSLFSPIGGLLFFSFLGELHESGVEVKYDECSGLGGNVEKGVPFSRITVLPLPALAASVQQQQRNGSEEVVKKQQLPPRKFKDKPLTTLLRKAHSSNRGKGWRAKDRGLDANTRFKSTEFKETTMKDHERVKGYLEGCPNKVNMHRQRGQNGKIKPRSTKFNPLSFHYLNHAWGVGKNFIRKLEKESEAPPVATKPCNNPSRQSVIDHRAAARLRYTAKNLFVQNYVARQQQQL